MHHSFSQCPSLSRSFCRVSASLLLDIVRLRYCVIGEELMLMLVLIGGRLCSRGRALDLGGEPWGTPKTTLTASEVDPSIITDCFLLGSQFCIHPTDFPIIP